MKLKTVEANVYTQDRGRFKAVRDSNVLIYFPHGFGDWVQFSTVTQFLHPSNRYWMTRFGDDNVSVMEEDNLVRPLYLGVNSTHCSDGETYGAKHLGLDFDSSDGGLRQLNLPLGLAAQWCHHDLQSLLWIGFPETWGSGNSPYHTKARSMIASLTDDAPCDGAILSAPLKSSLNFHTPGSIGRLVEARLRSFTGWTGKKLCLISRNGYTAVGKNWGHMFREDMPEGERREGAECRQFMRLMLRKDSGWVFLVIEDRMFSGHDTVRDPELNCYSFAELFGEPETAGMPFGWVLKALTALADLSIGVPTGPHHLAMVKPDLPCVGLWVEHLPSWYDEPKECAYHLISRNVRDRGFWQRPGSFMERGNLHYRGRELTTRIIPASDVLQAVEEVLGI